MAADLRLHLVVAVARNQGIGYRGTLPWPRLRTDMKFMAQITTRTVDSNKENAVVMGRKTWESIPAKNRPLKDRFNIVLSSRNSTELPGAHMVCSSLTTAVSNLKTPPFSEQIESVYILGGSSVYSEALDSPLCGRIYLTEIMAEFPADTFFPPINTTLFHEIEDAAAPREVLEENGVKFRFKIYERTST